MKKILLLAVSLIFVSSFFAQYDSRKLAGTYQYCPFPCETIKLNEDFTFDYLLDGDLFNNERTKGTWKFLSENTIYLKSPERKSVYKVTENQKFNSDKITVQVIDQTTAIVPGIVIKIKYLGSERQYVTDDDGTCEIPKTDEIEIYGYRVSEKYKIQDSDTNYLTIQIELSNEPSVDDTFLFKDGRLYKIFEDNTVSENWYKKLSKKKADKLFPKN